MHDRVELIRVESGGVGFGGLAIGIAFVDRERS
jgi:hypothetical protein